MLKSLHLTDFQAHKDLQVDFGPGVSCIVGPTDAGKSAVLRALRWVCLNDLSGDEFVREGARETRIQLHTDEGAITRVKGSGENRYRMGSKDFKAFGVSVPEDIAASLRVNEINFQSQHDAPFWFSESAPEVSRRLNAVIDLSVIDSALSYVASEVRSSKEREQLVQERITETKKELEDLLPQESRIADFTQLKKRYENFTTAQSHRRGLGELGTTIRDSREAQARRVDQNGDRELVLQAAARSLSATKKANELKVLVDVAEAKAAKKAPPDFSGVEKAKKNWDDAYSRRERLYGLTEAPDYAREDVQDALDRVTKAQEKLNRVKVCPTCQRPI